MEPKHFDILSPTLRGGFGVARFILRRLLLMLPMVLVALTVTFVMVQMAPGSPFSSQRRLPPEIEANLKAKYGFDQPKVVQYTRFLARLAGFRYENGRGYRWQGHPDFGDSTKYKDKSVNQIIKEALPVSVVLGLFAYALALGVGLGMGILAAYRQNTWIDHSANGIAMLGLAVPNFVLGPVLVLIFSLTLYWLPPARLEWAYEWGYIRIPTLRTILLPALTLSALYIAYIARLTRSGLVVDRIYIYTGSGAACLLFLHGLRLVRTCSRCIILRFQPMPSCSGRKHYFAYGSNLKASQMQARIGRVPAGSIARLPGYRLAFNTSDADQKEIFANIMPDDGNSVWGVIYECDEAELKKLDEYEDVDSGHYRRGPVMVVTPAQEHLEAMAYFACQDRLCGEGQPSARYSLKIVSGARQHGLPAEYVHRIETLAGLTER
jgi:oligopeptide transport system permease protein